MFWQVLGKARIEISHFLFFITKMTDLEYLGLRLSLIIINLKI